MIKSSEPVSVYQTSVPTLISLSPLPAPTSQDFRCLNSHLNSQLRVTYIVRSLNS